MKAGGHTVHRVAKCVALLLCAVVAAALLPPPAECAQASGKVVRVGWFESPFNRMDRFERRSGYGYEYQQKIAAYTGWSYEYVEGSWSELMRMLIDGELDLLSDVSFTEARAEQMLFPSMPMGTEEYYLFVEPNNTKFTPGDYDYFNGRRVGVNRGSVQEGFLESWLQSYGIRAEVVELTCPDAEAFEMLKAGELDGVVSLDAYGTAGTAVPEIRIGSSDFYFAVNRERPDLLKELDAALTRIQDEDRFYSQELFQKYVNTFSANVYLSDEESAWLERHGAIRVGYQDDYLAFCAMDERTGELTGILKDYLADAADCLANAHLDFEAVAYPSADAAMEALEGGEIDCMFPSNLSVYDGEVLGVVMTPPIIRAEAYALVRKAEQQGFFGQEQVTIAVEPSDINYRSVVRDLFPDWQMQQFPDTKACLRAVSTGEADCYLTNNYQYNELGKECDRLGLTLIATGKEADFSIAVNKGSLELYSILTRTTSIISDTSMNAAMTYYTAEAAKLSLAGLIRENLAVVISAVVIIVAMALLLIFQRRTIVAQRRAEESQRQVEDLHRKVYVDALTRVRNKGGFDKYVQQLQEQLDRGEAAEVAVCVFDCNDLKLINDQCGHEKGNIYLKTACSLICRTFQHSPVFRIGGDEFVAVLMNDDFRNREALVRRFDGEQRRMSAQAEHRWERVSVSIGVAQYDPQTDRALGDTFHRADQLMYEDKRVRKNIG